MTGCHFYFRMTLCSFSSPIVALRRRRENRDFAVVSWMGVKYLSFRLERVFLDEFVLSLVCSLLFLLLVFIMLEGEACVYVCDICGQLKYSFPLQIRRHTNLSISHNSEIIAAEMAGKTVYVYIRLKVLPLRQSIREIFMMTKRKI